MCLAIPGLIVSTTGEGITRSATVRFGSVEREVNLGFTPEAQVNDYVIVHVGCAINVIDSATAEQQLQALRQALDGSREVSDHEIP